MLPAAVFANQKPIKINQIDVSGNLNSKAEMIIATSGLKAGTDTSPLAVKRAIKNLWALDIFSDVQIVAENQTAAGISLLIQVREYPRLFGWDVSGNQKLKIKEIAKQTGFYDGMILTPFNRYQAEKALLKTYHAKGYLLANVDIRIIQMAPDEVLAKITIQEGDRVQVKKIRVFGNGNIPDKELRKAFKQVKENRFWRGADFDRKKYESDLENIIALCQRKGFRDAEISKDSIYYSEDKRDLFIDVYVKEGRQYYLGEVNFQGNQAFSTAMLQSVLQFKPGEVYNRERFEQSIREDLQNLYYNEGYLFANIQPLEIPRENRVDIYIRIDEGHVVRIKEVLISGNTKTNENVIRREFDIHPGEIFNRAKLERSIRNVWATNYFANVYPDVKLRRNDDEFIDLEVNVEEKSADLLNFSLGFSGSEGVIGNAGITLNNFSLKRPFSGGDGQRLSLQWDQGGTYRNLALSFTEPWAFGAPTLVGFSLFDTRFDGSFRPWDGRETGGSLLLGRRFNWLGSAFRADWSFRYAQNQISNIRDESQAALFETGSQDSRQISLSQTLRRDTRNRPDFPTKGSVFSLNSKLAGGPLQGDEDFLKNIVSAEWYTPLNFGAAFVMNSRLGIISGLRKNYYANPNERFFMGGSGLGYTEGLRGYDFGAVGPQNETGDALGGRSLAKLGAEVRLPLLKSSGFYGLVFAEAGNVWNSFSDATFGDLKRSAGFGFRLNAPFIGLIGVDFGYGFDHFDSLGNRNGLWKIHFNFGQF